MNRTLRELSAAPTPALPHGGGSVSLANRRVVAELVFQPCAIRRPQRRIVAILFPPPWGRARVEAENQPHGDDRDTTTTTPTTADPFPTPWGRARVGAANTPRSDDRDTTTPSATTAILSPPPWGRARVGAANTPRSDGCNTTTTTPTTADPFPPPWGRARVGAANTPRSGDTNLLKSSEKSWNPTTSSFLP